jgi:hypothetical protein
MKKACTFASRLKKAVCSLKRKQEIFLTNSCGYVKCDYICAPNENGNSSFKKIPRKFSEMFGELKKHF